MVQKFRAHVSGSRTSATSGMRGVLRNYERLIGHMEMATPEILMEAMEPTFDKSQDYCPEDTGELRESGYLEITQFRKQPRVEIGYGRGGEPEYAVAVHENLEWRHKAPTRAKWLQIAVEEDAQAIQGRIIRQYTGMF